MDILQRLLLKPYTGIEDHLSGGGNGGDDRNGFVGLVAVVAVIAALSGHLGIAAAIVFGVIAIYIGLLVLRWILGGVLYAITAAIRNPFVVLGRLMTGSRAKTGSIPAQNNDKAEERTETTSIRPGIKILLMIFLWSIFILSLVTIAKKAA